MAGTPIPSISLDDVASGKEEEVGGLKVSTTVAQQRLWRLDHATRLSMARVC